MKERGGASAPRDPPRGCWRCSRPRRRRPQWKATSGQQYVGNRPAPQTQRHRADDGRRVRCWRRSRSSTAPQALAEVMTRAGEHPEVVLEATYGWYWAVDALQAAGASVHLAHPLGVKAFEYRRHKDDLPGLVSIWRTCCGWDGCPSRGSPRRPPGSCASWSGTGPSWSPCAPLQGRGPRGAGQVRGRGADERPVRGGRHRSCWTGWTLPKPYAARIASLRRVMDLLDFEIDVFAGLAQRPAGQRPGLHRGADHPRDRPDPGRGVRRRDRRRAPVRAPRSS